MRAPRPCIRLPWLRLAFAGLACLSGLGPIVSPRPASAAQHTFLPATDLDDGIWIGEATWDYRPSNSPLSSILLSCGMVDDIRQDLSLGYTATTLSEGQSVEDARLRFNEQGGALTGNLTLQISGAAVLDALVTPGGSRFGLPRTAANVLWNVTADWDSSGQRIAKYEESPDVSAIVNEVLALPGWDTSTKSLVFFVEVVAPLSGNEFLRTDDTHAPYSPGGNAGIRPARLLVSETLHDTFYGKELLCRPTPTSVDVNIVPRFETEAFCAWGSDSTALLNSTPTAPVAANTAHQFQLEPLVPNTRHYYQLNFRRAGDPSFEVGPVRSFVALPEFQDEARLCVTSDIHVTNMSSLGIQPDLNLLEDALPYMRDFPGASGYHLWMDLGDLVVIRATRVAFDLEETEQRYREARDYIDLIGHSLPFVFVRGNHEEVSGWEEDGTADNTTVWSGNMLLKYLAPPLPNATVSGNATPLQHVGVPGNYFAFDIGKLRIRALDPYLYSTTRPHNGHGETGGSLNGWDWRLGEQQYNWLQSDLETHPRPYSLVALHHLTSCYVGAGEYYGRGGIEIAKWSVAGRPTFEWGGEDGTGSNLITSQRPEYAAGPIHDLLTGAGNQVILKGHDHFHARQSLDDMTYVTLAKPNDTGTQTGNLWGWRFFSFYPAAVTLFQPNSGFMSIVANDSGATYSYIQTYPTSGVGTVLDSFTILPSAPVDAPHVASTTSAVLRTSIDTIAPNPSDGAARIAYVLGRSGPMRLSLVDASGRRIRLLVDGTQTAGEHEVMWDGRDERGRAVSTGMFFARIEDAQGKVDAVKMLRLR